MGLFDSLFKKKEPAAAEPVCDPKVIYAPAEGKVIPLSEFPDPLFSQEALGPGCGILPGGDTVFAPFNGTVTQVIDTLHAVGVTSDGGAELLIHIGVDTVSMNGEGFEASVKTGQRIRLGQPLIRFDRQAIKAAGHPDAIAVVVTNGDDYEAVELTATGNVTVSTPILALK